jgi:hypothetical protein
LASLKNCLFPLGWEFDRSIIPNVDDLLQSLKQITQENDQDLGTLFNLNVESNCCWTSTKRMEFLYCFPTLIMTSKNTRKLDAVQSSPTTPPKVHEIIGFSKDMVNLGFVQPFMKKASIDSFKKYIENQCIDWDTSTGYY